MTSIISMILLTPESLIQRIACLGYVVLCSGVASLCVVVPMPVPPRTEAWPPLLRKHFNGFNSWLFSVQRTMALAQRPHKHSSWTKFSLLRLHLQIFSRFEAGFFFATPIKSLGLTGHPWKKVNVHITRPLLVLYNHFALVMRRLLLNVLWTIWKTMWGKTPPWCKTPPYYFPQNNQ